MSKRNMEKAREYGRSYYHANKEKQNAYVRQWYLKKLYGITQEEYDKMLFGQKNCCKICGKDASLFKKSLAVDHCHDTGVVRGLLCANCNLGIGKFMHDITLMQKAIKYLTL